MLSDTRTVLLIEKKYKLFEEMFAQMKKKAFLLFLFLFSDSEVLFHLETVSMKS